jgi:hypothetical protein
MSYEIRTIEYHRNEIEASAKRNQRRLDYDVEDVALSSWGDSQMISFHTMAINLLENGQEAGIDGPAADKRILWDKQRDCEVDAKVIPTQYGSCWILETDEEQRYGRKFIPIGERSRVQKGLGLEERWELRACSRYAGTACAGIGMPVSFFPQFDD